MPVKVAFVVGGQRRDRLRRRRVPLWSIVGVPAVSFGFVTWANLTDAPGSPPLITCRVMTVEKATASDIPRLVDLMGEFYAESHHSLDRAWASDSFRRLFAGNERGHAWIARDDSEAVGYVVLTLRHGMEAGGLVGFIDDLFVRPDARRRGIASALLRTLFAACKDLRAAAMHVEVGSENAAATELYRKFGLVPYTDGRRTLTARLTP